MPGRAAGATRQTQATLSRLGQQLFEDHVTLSCEAKKSPIDERDPGSVTTVHEYEEQEVET